MNKRCPWAGSDPLYIKYHDEEWGIPLHDDRKLFEFLILEGAQAGLSWITILRKREAYREAFDQFDPEKIARYSETDIQKLKANPGIIRNRLKIEATIHNARIFLETQDKNGSFDSLLWSFVDGQTVTNHWLTVQDIPSQTDLSISMSKNLKKMGFKFVGPTICYAFMQACGLVNDHLVTCFRHPEHALY